MIVFSFFTFFGSVKVVKQSDFKNKVLINKEKKEGFYDSNFSNSLYRLSDKTSLRGDRIDKTNFVGAINQFHPLLYSTTMNSYLTSFMQGLDIERSNLNRFLVGSMVNNSLFNNIFAIANSSGKIDTHSVRPFIFGVSNNNVASTSSLESLDGYKKLVGLNQMFFVNDSDKSYNIDDRYKSRFYDSTPNLQFLKDTKIKIPIPKEFRKKGVIQIEGYVTSENVSSAYIRVENKHSTTVRPQNGYGDPENKRISILVENDGNLDVLNLFIKGSKNMYSSFTYSFIDSKKINEHALPFIKPHDIAINYNKSYKFSLNMPTDGYLGTSIFYDNGFKINVNGEYVKKELVNGHFLGAKLNKGANKIVIEFEMPGFKIGAFSSVLGILFTIGNFIFERKYSK